MPLIARRDVLAFESLPLEEDMAVIGPITVELWVASDARDTDFTAKLVDMHPPSADYPTGFALNLTDGILRTRDLITTALDNLLASVRAGGVESFMIATVPCRDPQVRNFDMEDDQIASWVASNPEVIARFADPTTTNKIFTSWAHQNDVPVLDLYAALGCGFGGE